MKTRILTGMIAFLSGLTLSVAAGVPISDVTADGAASKAGAQAGDLILAIESTSIDSFPDLEKALAGHSPGDTIALQVQRGGKKQMLSVVLGGSPGGRATLGVMMNAPADPAVNTSRSIDAIERVSILRTVSAQLRDGYIYEEKGNLLATKVTEAVACGPISKATPKFDSVKPWVRSSTSSRLVM